MNAERRDDLGQKLLIGFILGGFGTILGFFINVVWGEAHLANTTANKALNSTIALEASYDSIQRDLTEIKSLLKRRI